MDSGQLLYDEVKMWRVDALKEYCRKRNLKVSGKKDELIARVFAASEMGVAVKPTAVQRVLKTEDEKTKLLITPDGPIPDPLLLMDGWLGENESMTSWPPIFLSNITIFLMSDHPGRDVNLHKRVLSEYKEGKAYRLFESGWIKEVFMHNIAVNSKYCFLKAKCSHSMKISDTAHTTWISVVKSTGRIISAYCTCVAGMSSSCIHVTAMLFRIEAANRCGLTNPACTSKPSVWNVPTEKTIVEPMMVCNMDWKASKLNKEPSRPAIDARRTLFDPVEKRCNQSESEKRHRLYLGLKDLLPDACFVAFNSIEQPNIPVPSVAQEVTVCDLISSPRKICCENSVLKLAKTSASSEEFLSSLVPLAEEEVNVVEMATVGQSDNETWYAQRKGRITASNFYKVSPKVNTIRKSTNVTVDVEKLMNSFLGVHKPPDHLPSLKYGRNMEPIAKAKYIKTFQKEHMNASYRECGLFIGTEKQYLGASPDLLIECSCCGKGVIEVKCPYSITNGKPSAENLPYLKIDHGHTTLKKNHPYYAQIQGQMALTKRNWCYFLVHTQKGQYVEKINFDSKYWHELEDDLTFFYHNYYAPQLVKQQQQSEYE